MIEKTKSFVKDNWQTIVKAALVVVFVFFVYGEYQEWKQQKQVPVVQTISLPPQVIHSTTETVREVAVQAPSTPGAVLQFVEKQGKVIAVVNGQEVEVPNLSDQRM